ncbi:MAG: Na+/H+ antiporter subunit E [Candidatus Fermentibacteria bacterium]
MKRYFSVLFTAVVLLCIWIFLTLSFHPTELVLGFAVSLIIAVATHGSFTGNLLRLLRPARLTAGVIYVFYFMGKMFMSNIDVLFRVLRPVVPVRPGIVKASLMMSSERARNIVANSITLTPGTLTVEMTETSIFVHWISLPEGDIHEETQKMVDGFANRIKRIFE